MLILGVDTSTPAVTVGLGEVDGELARVKMLARRGLVDARAHGERLTPLVQESLSEAGAAVGDIGAIVAGTGPGPFTGLRVGLVTATALGQTLRVPVYGSCSLDVIGAGLAGATAPTLVATDARRKEIYWAVYGADGERVAGPAVAKPDSLPDEARLASRAAGAGARKYADVLGLSIVDGFDHPPAEELVRSAAGRALSGAPSETLTPLYLRRPNINVNGEQQRI